MQKEWKAIKVTIGKERQVVENLQELGIESYAPMVTVTERHGGVLEEKHRYLLEGYLLIFVEWTTELYYKLKDMWYVHYPLAGTVAQSEVDYLKAYETWGCQSIIDYSQKIVTYKGPIAQAPERILKVDRRKGRALIKLELGADNIMKRWLPVKIVR